ncbi:hypothetical protein ES708_18021 [subsurface metagenome]
MKKLIFILSIVLFYSCAVAQDAEHRKGVLVKKVFRLDPGALFIQGEDTIVNLLDSSDIYLMIIEYGGGIDDSTWNSITIGTIYSLEDPGDNMHLETDYALRKWELYTTDGSDVSTITQTPSVLSMSQDDLGTGDLGDFSIINGTAEMSSRDISKTTLSINPAAAQVSSSYGSFPGLTYQGDYSGYFNNSSLINKGFSDATYAPAAEGVTNGDSHDHTGGAGAQIDHTDLSSIGANTHAAIDGHGTRYHN